MNKLIILTIAFMSLSASARPCRSGEELLYMKASAGEAVYFIGNYESTVIKDSSTTAGSATVQRAEQNTSEEKYYLNTNLYGIISAIRSEVAVKKGCIRNFHVGDVVYYEITGSEPKKVKIMAFGLNHAWDLADKNSVLL